MSAIFSSSRIRVEGKKGRKTHALPPAVPPPLILTRVQSADAGAATEAGAAAAGRPLPLGEVADATDAKDAEEAADAAAGRASSQEDVANATDATEAKAVADAAERRAPPQEEAATSAVASNNATEGRTPPPPPPGKNQNKNSARRLPRKRRGWRKKRLPGRPS